MEKLLMIPGPSRYSDRVRNAMSVEPIGHRTSDFEVVLGEINEYLPSLFNTSGDTYVFTSSSTGAMEAAISNFVEKNQKVTVGINGVFGKRLFDISNIYSNNAVSVEKDFGKPLLESDFDSDTDILCLVHNETSTGIQNPIKDIIRHVKNNNPDCLVIVDCVSSLGGTNFDMDGWEIDIAISGSQKCIASPPGLGLLAVREGLSEKATPKNYYFGLVDHMKYSKLNQTPFTPAIPLFFGLREALKEIEEEGLSNRIQRHYDCARLFRKGTRDIGFDLFVDDAFASNSVTSISHHDPVKFKESMYEKGIVIEGAKGSSKIFRVGHLGNVTKNDIKRTLNVMDKIGVRNENSL